MNATFEAKQTKFNNGEIDPSLYGDVTHPKFLASLRTCLGWLPIQNGALVKWPGTKYIANTKNNGAVRLIKFVFSDAQAFLLEVGNNYIRFYKNGQYVGNDGNLHTTGDGYVGGYYELATTITSPMLPFLKFAQVGDLITLAYGAQAGGSLAPQDLRHTSGALKPWSIGATPLAIPAGAVTWSGFPLTLFNGVAFYNNAVTYNIGDQAVTASGGSQTYWTCIQNGVTGAGQAPPSPPTLNANGEVAGTLYWVPSTDRAHTPQRAAWVFTAVVQDANGTTYESQPSPKFSTNVPLSSDRQFPVWLETAPTLAAGYTLLYYNVFRSTDGGGTFGWLSSVRPGDLDTTYPGQSPVFLDDGRTPDYTKQPPAATDPFLVNGADAYPAVISYLDQRRLFAGGGGLPSGLAFSKDGDLYNWDDRKLPGADIDSIRILLISEVLEQVRGFASLARGVALTGQGEFTIAGANGGALSRSSRSAIRQSKWGSSWLNPILIGKGLLFNTAKSNQVRDFYPLYGLYNDVWDGQDLSVLARHLFTNYTLVDWDFQAVPYPIVRAIRSDGTLLGMLYQHAPPSFGINISDAVVAWARRGTGNGFDRYENACVVPEPPEDATYYVVKRFIPGTGYVRFIEREASPTLPFVPALYSPVLPPTANIPGSTGIGLPDARYGVFLDAALSFDGHVDPTNAANNGTLDSVANPGSTNLADFAVGKQVKFSVTSTPFLNTDPGTAVIVLDPENVNGLGTISMAVVGYTNSNVVTCELLNSLTQAQLQYLWGSGYAVHNPYWGISRSTYAVAHLNGYAVDSGTKTGSRGVWVLADGYQVDPSQFTFVAGVLTLAIPALVVCVGIAYNSDAELLDAFHPNAELRNKKKTLNRVGFEVANTRDLYVGRDLNTLVQWQQRTVAMGYGRIPLQTGYFEVPVQGGTDKDGRLSIRHFTPLPATLTSVLREFHLGDA